MKKKALILSLFLALATGGLRAQSISQLLTMLELDIQKLGAMKSTLNDMIDGYRIIEQGFNTVKGIAKDNFSLHKDFLDAMLVVSPTVSQSPKVDEILRTETTIVGSYPPGPRSWERTGQFSPLELAYIDETWAAVYNKSAEDMDELTLLLTDGELRMTDAERLKAIDRIDADIREQLTFLREFDANGMTQALQRAQATNDIKALRLLHGITQ